MHTTQDNTTQSTSTTSAPGESQPQPLPLMAPCRQVGLDAPWRWLKLGWQDFTRALPMSLGYGVVMAIIGALITWVAWQAGSIVLAIALVAGFFFMGPAIAMGLYSISRQLEAGMEPQLMRCLREGKKHLGNELVLAFIFLVVFLIWMRAASMTHIFFPSHEAMDMQDLLLFLGVGTAIGAVFAALIFTAGAFSIPMMMDKQVDAVTAVITSVCAVLSNKKTMLLWGILIVTGILLGVATGFIGFAIFLPVIGHATWHAYREVIDASAWPSGPGLHHQNAEQKPSAVSEKGQSDGQDN